MRLRTLLRWSLVLLLLGFAPSIDQADSQSPDQRPIVVLLPCVNHTADPGFDTLAGTIRSTLHLNLVLLNQYRVSLLEIQPEHSPEAVVVAVSLKRETDDRAIVIVAEVSSGGSSGRSSFTAAPETMAILEQRAVFLLDVFDAADRLTESVVETLTGRRIEYGSLSVVNDGNPAAFRVRLDTQDLGTGPLRIAAIVAGGYELTIEQDRLVGTEVVLRRQISIEPGREEVVRFDLPLLSAEDERYLRDIDSQVRRALRHDDALRAREILTRVQDAVSGFGAHAGSLGYTWPAERYDAWRTLLDTGNSWSDPVGRSVLSANVTRQVNRHFGVTAPAGVVLPPATSMLNRYHAIPYRTILVDGDLSDWEGIRPVLTPDLHTEQPYRAHTARTGMMYAGVYLARDDRNLYVRIDAADGEISRSGAVSGTAEPGYWVFLRHQSDESIVFEVTWSGSMGWYAHVFTHGSRGSAAHARGTLRLSGNVLEASVPIQLYDRLLEPNQSYHLHTGSYLMNRTAGGEVIYHKLGRYITY